MHDKDVALVTTVGSTVFICLSVCSVHDKDVALVSTVGSTVFICLSVGFPSYYELRPAPPPPSLPPCRDSLLVSIVIDGRVT